jgi:hypothetical protein
LEAEIAACCRKYLAVQSTASAEPSNDPHRRVDRLIDPQGYRDRAGYWMIRDLAAVVSTTLSPIAAPQPSASLLSIEVSNDNNLLSERSTGCNKEAEGKGEALCPKLRH